MAEIYDFSKVKMRCSSLYYLVCDGKNRTPKQKYADLEAMLADEMDKYNNIASHLLEKPTGLRKAAKIAGIEWQLKQLEPKRYEDPLPQGARSYLKAMYGEIKYGKKPSFKDKGNKYTNKGKHAEESSLQLIGKLDNYPYIKNEIRLENEMLSGIPDTYMGGKSIYEAEYIPDVKSSWDWGTFSENIGNPLNPVYWWQEQGYFALSGAQGGEVSYCLISLPEHLLMAEIDGLRNRMAKQLNVIDVTVTDEYKMAEFELINNLTFDEIPEQERRLKFEVKRNDDAIQKIYDTVPKCREYLQEIQEMHLMGVFSDKELPILDTIEEL